MTIGVTLAPHEVINRLFAILYGVQPKIEGRFFHRHLNQHRVLGVVIGDQNGDGIGYFSRHQYSVTHDEKKFHTNRFKAIARRFF